MKEIQLHPTEKYTLFALVDDEDYGWLSKFHWNVQKGNNTYYAITSIDGQNFLMHRLIAKAASHVYVDHKDGDGLNCQKFNLRECTRSQNQMNRPKQANNTSGYKGVSWQKNVGKWQATIQVNKHRKYLGYFNTPEQAADVYDKAAKEIFGEFARTNS